MCNWNKIFTKTTCESNKKQNTPDKLWPRASSKHLWQISANIHVITTRVMEIHNYEDCAMGDDHFSIPVCMSENDIFFFILGIRSKYIIHFLRCDTIRANRHKFEIPLLRLPWFQQVFIAIISSRLPFVWNQMKRIQQQQSVRIHPNFNTLSRLRRHTLIIKFTMCLSKTINFIFMLTMAAWKSK